MSPSPKSKPYANPARPEGAAVALTPDVSSSTAASTVYGKATDEDSPLLD